jgi:hypothetical protein
MGSSSCGLPTLDTFRSFAASMHADGTIYKKLETWSYYDEYDVEEVAIVYKGTIYSHEVDQTVVPPRADAFPWDARDRQLHGRLPTLRSRGGRRTLKSLARSASRRTSRIIIQEALRGI